MYGQPKKPITPIRTDIRDQRPSSPKNVSGSTETSAIEKSSCGKASRKSITRLITASTQPPTKPAARPRIAPITVDTAAARNATKMEVCAP